VSVLYEYMIDINPGYQSDINPGYQSDINPGLFYVLNKVTNIKILSIKFYLAEKTSHLLHTASLSKKFQVHTTGMF